MCNQEVVEPQALSAEVKNRTVVHSDAFGQVVLDRPVGRLMRHRGRGHQALGRRGRSEVRDAVGGGGVVGLCRLFGVVAVWCGFGGVVGGGVAGVTCLALLVEVDAAVDPAQD